MGEQRMTDRIRILYAKLFRRLFSEGKLSTYPSVETECYFAK